MLHSFETFLTAISPNTNITTSCMIIAGSELHDRYLRIHASCRGEKPRESIIAFRKRTFMPIRGT